MIEISHLYKSYGTNTVLNDYSATISDGITCLTGPSGSGKTTLVRILAGLEDGDSGTVKGAGGNVVFLFQEPRLLPWKTLEENVLLAARKNPGNNREKSRNGGQTPVADREILRNGGLSPVAYPAAYVRHALEKLGFGEGDLVKKPEELSGGMQQRAAIARAATAAEDIVRAGSSVDLCVLDEPLKGLDADTRAAAVDFIRREICEKCAITVIITHSEEDIADFGGDVLSI